MSKNRKLFDEVMSGIDVMCQQRKGMILMQSVDEPTLLAEAVLAEDCLKPEEDEAWAHLQPGK